MHAADLGNICCQKGLRLASAERREHQLQLDLSGSESKVEILEAKLDGLEGSASRVEAEEIKTLRADAGQQTGLDSLAAEGRAMFTADLESRLAVW